MNVHKSQVLQVYCEVQVIYANEMKERKEDEEILITKLRKAEGNLFQLEKISMISSFPGIKGNLFAKFLNCKICFCIVVILKMN